MTEILNAFCPGRVRGQGSLNFYGFRKNGTAIIRGKDEEYAWRDEITDIVRMSLPFEHVPLDKDVPVATQLLFVYARPKDHYRANGELKDWASTRYYNLSGSGIDVDKSARLVHDALTNSGLISDDKQVAMNRNEKIYVNEAHSDPGVHIIVWSLA